MASCMKNNKVEDKHSVFIKKVGGFSEFSHVKDRNNVKLTVYTPKRGG